MNLDNSGPTIVMDAKSKEGIEALQNKITMLDAEAIRIARLKATLEGDVRKLEAQLSHVQSSEKEVSNNVLLLKTTLQEINKEIVAAVEERDAIQKQIEAHMKQVKTKHDALEVKESDLIVREIEVIESEKTLAENYAFVRVERDRIRKALADTKKILENI